MKSSPLANAARNVKKGGRLLYSTCTFAPEENEMQLAHFLSEHGDFRLIDVNERVADITHDGLTEFDGEKLPPDMKKCRRFYPHVFSGEGQFMALLERNCENNEENTVRAEKNEKKRKKDERKPKDTSGESVIFEFLHDVLTPEGICEAEKYRLIQRGNIYYLAPNISDTLPDRCVKSPGVPVGELQKGRVIPHHNFFMAYGSFFKRKIVLAADDGRVVKYLHGESIECNAEKGFAAVTFGKAVLGGAKVSGNEAKNYYPKGLRI
ncbi:MAG: hypothetical protein U0M06_03555 [Clostridia bacterium]|nr:hypothetical protein [Clostridia bacterium]